MTAWTAASNQGPLDIDVPNKDQYIDGLMCWGQNPAVGGPSCDFERKAMENLKWMVVVELWETETAAFWKRPGVDPTTINTEVLLLPAAASYEKEGSIVNSGRWSQWRYKASDPPKADPLDPSTWGPHATSCVETGGALDDLEIINRLAKKLISLYQADPPGLLADPVAKLHWGFYPGVDAHGFNGASPNGYETAGHADPHKVAWEINGYFCPTSTTGTPGRRVDGFWGSDATKTTLQEDGKTSSGNWLYCSHYVNPGDPINCFDSSATTPTGNRQENRDPVEKTRIAGSPGTTTTPIGLYQNWSVCWPLNRRIIYNGASVYQTGHPKVGQPLAPDKWVLDFGVGGTGSTGPTANGGDVTDGFTAPGGGSARYPYIMQREGHAHLFGYGREDGPFPEHYEPWETVMTQNYVSQTLTSPTNFGHARPEAYEHPGYGNPEFPIIGTTYRVTEHWQAGQLTRNNPWLCQLQPNAFVELGEELAGILGISDGDMVEMKTQRTNLYGTTMTAVACVTKRFTPYNIKVDSSLKTVHHIGTIWHFGYTGCCTGDSANLLTPHIGDANTGIPESKAFICNIRKYPSGSWLT